MWDVSLIQRKDKFVEKQRILYHFVNTSRFIVAATPHP
jgi:hypothetical protein